MRYYFQIVLDGWVDDKDSVNRLKSNLEGEIYHQDSHVYKPIYHDVYNCPFREFNDDYKCRHSDGSFQSCDDNLKHSNCPMVRKMIRGVVLNIL